MKIIAPTDTGVTVEIVNPPLGMLMAMAQRGIRWETVWPDEPEQPTHEQMASDLVARIMGALLHGRSVRLEGKMIEPIQSRDDLNVITREVEQALASTDRWVRPLIDDGEHCLVIASRDGRHLH